MRVRAIRPFKDKKNNNILRNPKDAKTAEFDCAPERFKELKKNGYVVEVKAETKAEEKAEEKK
jgi:hypothetical protein